MVGSRPTTARACAALLLLCALLPADAAGQGLPVTAPRAAVPLDDPTRVDGWRADIALVVATAQRTHAGPTRPAHGPAFTGAADALAARVPTTDDARLAVELQRLLARLGDGHSLVYPAPGPRVGFPALPIDLWRFEDGLVVTDGSGDGAALVGARLAAIGGVPVDTLLARMAPYVSRDNDIGLLAFASLWLPQVIFLEAWGARGAPGVCPGRPPPHPAEGRGRRTLGGGAPRPRGRPAARGAAAPGAGAVARMPGLRPARARARARDPR